MSRWLFFPSSAVGFNLVLDGTVTRVSGSPVNSAFTGTITASTGTLPVGLSSLQHRAGFGLGFIFSSQSQRDIFISNYPAGVGVWNVEIGTSTGSTGSGWTYDTSTNIRRAYIAQSDFSPFAPAPYAVGEAVEVSHS